MGKRKNDNKGFTLVELIVVITILGILAAMMIPALLGYIDRAKGQQVMLNAKSVYTAAQADLSSAYAKGIDPRTIDKQSVIDTADVSAVSKVIVVGTKRAYVSGEKDKTKAHEMYTVGYVYYREGDSAIEFKDKEWKDADLKDDADSVTLPETDMSKIKIK